MSDYAPSTDEVQGAIREADEYMADHRVTESWRVISRLHATLVSMVDRQNAREESVRAEERERIARNIEAAEWWFTFDDEDVEPGEEFIRRYDAARIVREGA